MMIDMNKKYATRGGRPVRLLAVDLKVTSSRIGCSLGTIVGVTTTADGLEEVNFWAADGTYLGNGRRSGMDLIEEIPSVVSFHTVYPTLHPSLIASLDRAQQAVAPHALGILEVIRKGRTVTTKFHPKEQA